jgi:hypothetical protein
MPGQAQPDNMKIILLRRKQKEPIAYAWSADSITSNWAPPLIEGHGFRGDWLSHDHEFLASIFPLLSLRLIAVFGLEKGKCFLTNFSRSIEISNFRDWSWEQKYPIWRIFLANEDWLCSNGKHRFSHMFAWPLNKCEMPGRFFEWVMVHSAIWSYFMHQTKTSKEN